MVVAVDQSEVQVRSPAFLSERCHAHIPLLDLINNAHNKRIPEQ